MQTQIRQPTDECHICVGARWPLKGFPSSLPSLWDTKTQVETSSDTNVSRALKHQTAADRRALNIENRRGPGVLTVRSSVNTVPITGQLIVNTLWSCSRLLHLLKWSNTKVRGQLVSPPPFSKCTAGTGVCAKMQRKWGKRQNVCRITSLLSPERLIKKKRNVSLYWTSLCSTYVATVTTMAKHTLML